MKYITSIITLCAILALSSCKVHQLRHETYYLDYQEAGQGKVFLTESNSVSFDYEPLGSILVKEISGVSKKLVAVSNKERRPDDLYGPGPASKTVEEYTFATGQRAINYAVQQAIELGADGIINLRVEAVNPPKEPFTIVVTGMAIKRK